VAIDLAIKPLVYTAFVVCAFLPVAIAQTLWFRSPVSHRFSLPIDLGMQLRGRRVFGDHKTLRGFVIFVPLASVAFFALHELLIAFDLELARLLWEPMTGGYALLGLLAGLGFMLGELPNSFIKRQLRIAPGGQAAGRPGRVVQRIADRLDSTIGMLLAMSLLVDTPWQMWLYLIVVGPAVHFVFSILLTQLGLKGIPA